jgi:hypothetical protein
MEEDPNIRRAIFFAKNNEGGPTQEKPNNQKSFNS